MDDEMSKWLKFITDAVDRLGFIAIVVFMIVARVAVGSAFARAWAEFSRQRNIFVHLHWGHNMVVKLRGGFERTLRNNFIAALVLQIFMYMVPGTHTGKTMFYVFLGQFFVVLLPQLITLGRALQVNEVDSSRIDEYLAAPTLTQRETTFGPKGDPWAMMYSWVFPTVLNGMFMGIFAKVLANVFHVNQFLILILEITGMLIFAWGMIPVLVALILAIYFSGDGFQGRWKAKIAQIMLAVMLPGVTLENMNRQLPLDEEPEVTAIHRYGLALFSLIVSSIGRIWIFAGLEDWLPVWAAILLIGLYSVWRGTRYLEVKESRAVMLNGERMVGGDGGPYRTRINELDQESADLNREQQRHSYGVRKVMGFFIIKRLCEIVLAVMGVPFGISLFQPVVMGIKMLVFGPSPGEDLPTDPFNGVGVTRAGEALTSLNGMALTYMVVAVVFVFAVAWALKKALSGRGERVLNFVKWGMVVVVLCLFGAKVLKKEPIRLTESQTINTAYQQASGRLDNAHATVVNRVSTAVDSAVQPAAPRPATPPPVVQQPTVTIETPPARTGTRRVTRRRRSSGGASAPQDDMALFGQ